MPVDQQKYRDLIARASFDMSAYLGSVQDQSAARRPMTIVGSPTWARINGFPIFKQLATADRSQSLAVPRIVDVTSDFSVEWCGVPMLAAAGSDVLLSQRGATGGFEFLWDAVNSVFVVALYDAAGALARSITTPAASAVVQVATHVAMVSRAGGTAGSAFMRGLPVTATLGGAGVAANIGADSVVIAGGGGVGIMSSFLARAAAERWTNEDVTALYGQSRVLTGGDT